VAKLRRNKVRGAVKAGRGEDEIQACFGPGPRSRGAKHSPGKKGQKEQSKPEGAEDEIQNRLRTWTEPGQALIRDEGSMINTIFGRQSSGVFRPGQKPRQKHSPARKVRTVKAGRGGRQFRIVFGPWTRNRAEALMKKQEDQETEQRRKTIQASLDPGPKAEGRLPEGQEGAVKAGRGGIEEGEEAEEG
jgi:hypothetical protein